MGLSMKKFTKIFIIAFLLCILIYICKIDIFTVKEVTVNLVDETTVIPVGQVSGQKL